MTPTQRTRAWLKRLDVPSAVVERWNSFARVRQDLFGFADLVALGPRITAIQVTSGSNVSARINKIFDEPQAKKWLQAGGAIEVHGWRKAGAKGNRKTWQLRRVAITFDGMGVMIDTEIHSGTFDFV